jgi:phage tail sheath protein FI
MPQFVAPGVYVLERDFSDYVAALSQTAVGMVGTARRGPINAVTLITTPEQFLQTFGEPDANSYGPHAALNYLRRGNQLYYVRVAREFTLNSAVFSSYNSGTRTFTFVAAPTGLAVGNYMRIRQDGKRTSAGLKVESITSEEVVVTAETVSQLIETYDEAVAIMDYTDASNGAAANNAEVFAFDRYNNTLTDCVKFTARNPGNFSNYGSGGGVEVVIEDGGQFSNVDPVTGNTFTHVDGTPLAGVRPSAASVDTPEELLDLAASDGITTGQIRGVNHDYLNVPIVGFFDSTGDLELVVDDASLHTAGDTILINGTENYDGVFEIDSIDTLNQRIVLVAPPAYSADTVQGTILNKDVPAPAGVYICTDASPADIPANGTRASVWTKVGVLTKVVKVLFQGRQVEMFENVLGYDPTSSMYWDTVIGSPSNPVSDYLYAEYIGASGEQPINSYNRVKHPNNPRYLMGTSTLVKIVDSSVATTLLKLNSRGIDGDNPASADFIGTINSSGESSGLQHFRKTELWDINLLCCPGNYTASVVNEVIEVCNERNDCLGLVDPPLGLTVQEVIDWHNGQGQWAGLHSAFVTNKAALYYPWVKQYDPYSRKDIWLSPTCIMPGIIANNDFAGETWFAPAGIQRGQVPNARAVETVVSQGDMEVMYGPGNGNAVNPIAQFSRDGIVVWGQRTLQRTPTALDRVSVRRLLFFIEKSVASSVRRLVFEQNDPILWAQFTNLVEPFLEDLKGRRALEWFKVVCDESTNIPQRRNNNEMYAKIYIIPVKAAEKIVLDFTLLPSGASVDEFISADLG